LAFCKTQFNIENLNFVVAVMKYIDIFSVDNKCWTKSWSVLDNETANQVFEVEEDENGEVESVFHWPSSKVNRSVAVSTMEQIIDEYLKPDSQHEICVSAAVRENTFRRVKMVDVYGPQVFAEAIMEPINTMRNDILPRFLSSAHYIEMEDRLHSCNHLPSASELSIPYPEGSITDSSSLEDFPPERKFALMEILGCRYLFAEFLLYLRQSMCTEELLCYQMVVKFEHEFSSEKTHAHSLDTLWDIYRFFIAQSSAYEISLHYKLRKDLVLSMAEPHVAILDDVKRAVFTNLKNHFETFKQTAAYQNLSSLIADRIQSESLQKRALAKLNCFG